MSLAGRCRTGCAILARRAGDDAGVGVAYATLAEVKDEANLVLSELASLTRDFASSTVPAAMKREFGAFGQEVKRFVEGADTLTLQSDPWFAATYDRLREYHLRLGEWRDKFRAAGGDVTAPEPKERPDEGGTRWGLIALGAAAIVAGGIVLAKIVER